MRATITRPRAYLLAEQQQDGMPSPVEIPEAEKQEIVSLTDKDGVNSLVRAACPRDGRILLNIRHTRYARANRSDAR